ncbi:histidine kinase dimerization/phosphoacceptor domain -containing protein [Litorisediminicola beolgyonensis]|uniref:Histidine kinase dimerization/phosphoacceptor domain -containing protein n=1 Tax=Litorisediminicola beolgyonensis TaxID=1173614 RepID=A0ABW3ZFA5_9RHOB
MRAPVPENQDERLEELANYQILDTSSEKSFDDVVALIREICQVPTALISLVDKNRQWFKAREGFDQPETPIDQAICAHTILGTRVLEIPDTLEDRRTRDNPLCLSETDPVRFYAGAPLITPSGYALGSLCVLDTKPRRLNETQRHALEVLAGQVMRQMDLKRSLRNEEVLRAEIDHRVKNSLQTVASFIRIYVSRARSPESRDALEAVGRRVDAIAQLHRELYQTSEFDMVRLDTYLHRILDLMRGSLKGNVAIDAEIASVRVDSRKAATLAMIVSEFAANANKHAFPDGRDGVITIRVACDDDGTLRLECSDNGIGDQATQLDAGNDVSSIGMRLIESAAEQIGGQVEIGAGATGYRLSLVTDPGAVPDGPREVVLSAE